MKFRRETEFQETEIGKIPRDWRTFSLKEAFELYKGTTPSTKDSKYWGGTIPFATPTDITAINDLNMIYLTKTEKYLTEEGIRSKNLRIVPRGSLLFTSRATIGYLAINNVDVTINQGVIALIPKRKDVNILYYYYYLLGMRKKFEELAGGSTYREISMAMFSKTVIPQPPLQEQNRIANILSTIDRAIELYHGERERLERLKRGLMGELLTGRIRVREENGRLSFYRETELQETEIGEIPRDWKVVEFGVLFDFQRGLSYRKNDISTFQTPIRFITINDLEKEGGRKRDVEPIYLSEELEDSIINKKCTVEIGDILIAITDMSKGFIIGAPLYIDETLRNQGETLVYSMDLVKLLPKRSLNTKFYFYLLSWERVRKIMKSLARGTNVLHLDLNLTKKLKVIEPPLEEQGRIANILSTIDRTIELHHRGRERLERLKRGLMDLLLTGKVRVVDGDVGS
jgi:type I restriction enzyme S subunit